MFQMQMSSIVELLYKWFLDPFEEETYKEVWWELIFYVGLRLKLFMNCSG
jgi:hypothetical protein